MPNKKKKKRGRATLKPKKSSDKQLPVLIEKFSDANLQTWKRVSKEFTEFHYNYFFALHALRVAKYNQLCEALKFSATLSYEIKNWSRVVDYEFSLEPLSTIGSLSWLGGRFNFGSDLDANHFNPFNALYVASTSETAFREKFSMSDSEQRGGLTREELALTNKKSFSFVSVSGKVDNLFDLTIAKNLRSFLKLTQDFDIPKEVEELASKLKIPVSLISSTKELQISLLERNWRNWPTLYDIPSNSQVFGKILLDAGFEGVIYNSTKGTGKCLALFIQNWNNSDSYLELKKPFPNKVTNYRIDGQTWKEFI